MLRIFAESGFRFRTNGRNILLRSVAAFLVGVTLSLTLLNLVGLPITLSPIHPKTSLLKFSSYDELRSFLNASTYYFVPVYTDGISIRALAEFESSRTSEVDYSRTNVQVEGVDEADIVKCDGEYIYFASDKGLFIVKAYPPQGAKVLAHISFNGTIRGLLVNGDRLVVFEEDYGLWLFGEMKSRIWIYSLEDRSNPTLRREISLNGTYFTSRMVGDYVYALINQPAFLIDDEPTLPVIECDDQVEKADLSKVYYSNVSDYYYAYTTVLSFNMMREEAPKYEVYLVGATSAVYVSTDNIYVAIPRMPQVYEGASVRKVTEVQEWTEVHRIQISDGEIKYEVSDVVPGRVLNQFSMDEYSGYFRIATTANRVTGNGEEVTLVNNVYVLDMNLTIVGSLENFAAKESIYSARFMGDRCYLVTFKKVDPLFVIDLGDPTEPKVLGWLKITGYSDYLHPYDENHIIGIGKEAVAAEEGDFAWYQGVKISLFDVSDVEHPVEVDKYEVGDRGTDSPLLRDHKALLFDKQRGLLALPVLVAEIDEAQYPNGVPPDTFGEYAWQGVYVFRISATELTLRGRVTHIEDSNVMNDKYFVQRALYIGEVLYTISDGKIKMNDLEDLKEVKEIELP